MKKKQKAKEAKKKKVSAKVEKDDGNKTFLTFNFCHHWHKNVANDLVQLYVEVRLPSSV